MAALTAPGDTIVAPWTIDQVDALNAWQQTGWTPTYTCGGPCRDRDRDSGARQPRPERALVATLDGWICPTCDYTQSWASILMFSEPPPHPFAEHLAEIERAAAQQPEDPTATKFPYRERYRRQSPVAQFGGNTLNKIYGHVDDTADRLGIDRRDAHEVAARVLDMLEVGAERVGSRCPKCKTVTTETTGGFIPYPVCPEHGPFSAGGLVIAFPTPDDVVVPK